MDSVLGCKLFSFGEFCGGSFFHGLGGIGLLGFAEEARGMFGFVLWSMGGDWRALFLGKRPSPSVKEDGECGGVAEEVPVVFFAFGFRNEAERSAYGDAGEEASKVGDDIAVWREAEEDEEHDNRHQAAEQDAPGLFVLPEQACGVGAEHSKSAHNGAGGS